MRVSHTSPSVLSFLVLSVTSNIAVCYKVKLLKENAVQSPDRPSHPASRAADGIIQTREPYCTHTAQGENAWWQIQLTGLYVVKSVWLLNRHGAPQRLSQFNISVGNQSLPATQRLCRYHSAMVPAAGSKNISCDTRVVGSYVSVRKTTNAGGPYLTICEVEVYGYRICEPGYFKNDCVSCNCKDACSLETGKCPTECLPGWEMKNCQTACKDKKWGPNCPNQCMCKDASEVCNKASGACKSGCTENYVGTGCERELQTVDILTPKILSSSSISVRWKLKKRQRNHVLAASSFVVQYRLKGFTAWTNQSVNIKETGTGSVMNYMVSGLIPNNVYLFRVVPQSTYNGVRYDSTPSPNSPEAKTSCGVPVTPLIQRSWVDCDDKGRTVRIIVSWEDLGQKSHGCNSYSRTEVLYFPRESPQSTTVIRTKPKHKVVNIDVTSPRNADYGVIVRVFNDRNISTDSLTVSAGTSRNSKCKTAHPMKYIDKEASTGSQNQRKGRIHMTKLILHLQTLMVGMAWILKNIRTISWTWELHLSQHIKMLLSKGQAHPCMKASLNEKESFVSPAPFWKLACKSC